MRLGADIAKQNPSLPVGGGRHIIKSRLKIEIALEGKMTSHQRNRLGQAFYAECQSVIGKPSERRIA